MKLRVLIADDEMLARRRLQRLLAAMDDVEVVGECEDGAAVLQRIIQEPAPHAVLLDIQMPGLSGVEAMALWPAAGPAILFTTAYAEHALQAFEGGAVDYLLKPIEPGRLRKALERVQERIAQRAAGAATVERLALPTRTGLVLLDPGEIRCALIEGESAVLSTDRGRFFTDWRLSELEERLPPADFLRTHRKALVNLRRVLRLEDEETGGYTAYTDGGEAVPVSRKVARELRRRWGL